MLFSPLSVSLSGSLTLPHTHTLCPSHPHTHRPCARHCCQLLPRRARGLAQLAHHHVAAGELRPPGRAGGVCRSQGRPRGTAGVPDARPGRRRQAVRRCPDNSIACLHSAPCALIVAGLLCLASADLVLAIHTHAVPLARPNPRARPHPLPAAARWVCCASPASARSWCTSLRQSCWRRRRLRRSTCWCR